VFLPRDAAERWKRRDLSKVKRASFAS